MLKISNLSKSYGGVKAVHNCTCHFQEGMITGLIGPNGAGKTTLYNLITGLEKPDQGRIYFDGIDITSWPTHKIARQGLARSFQLLRLFKNLTIAENLLLALNQTDENPLLNLFYRKQAEAGYYPRMQATIDRLGVKRTLKTKVSELSYGQTKLIDIAIALLKDFKLVMLDEPAAGVNPAIRQELKQVVRELKKAGKTVVIIEHDMDFVMDLSDHVICMAEGTVLSEGRPKNVRNDKKVLEAYLGKSG